MSELDKAANPTIEEAIKYLDGMIFTQDFHPSTLIEALREQAEADRDRDGRCMVLPCKVGTSVFDISDGTAYETRVLNFVVGRDGVSCKTVSSWPDVSEFGTRIFLTRESAEAALKGASNAD